MKILHFKNSLFLAVMVMAVSSCGKLNCIDTGLSDHYTSITKEWVANDTIDVLYFVDDKGNGQTLDVITRDSTVIKDAFSDDCGNYYDNSEYTIEYKASKSPFTFRIFIKSECITNYTKEDRFTVTLTVNNYNVPDNSNSKSATYDIVSERVAPEDATITKHDRLTIGGRTYDGVLEFTFGQMFSDQDIKTLYYAKDHGVVKFTDGWGKSFVAL